MVENLSSKLFKKPRFIVKQESQQQQQPKTVRRLQGSEHDDEEPEKENLQINMNRDTRTRQEVPKAEDDRKPPQKSCHQRVKSLGRRNQSLSIQVNDYLSRVSVECAERVRFLGI